MNREHAAALQPEQQSKTPSQKQINKSKISNVYKRHSNYGSVAFVSNRQIDKEKIDPCMLWFKTKGALQTSGKTKVFSTNDLGQLETHGKKEEKCDPCLTPCTKLILGGL